ncbi:DrmB family protein [Sutcliffiella horikoshii]|uniref:DrmB family protein n=1 Tax=Sutcliffiella horikoshii TaxID=79883 RepID=UPI00384BB70C
MSKKIGELRPSQFITTFGPGSIVDLPDYSVIIGGIDKWDSFDVSKSKTIEENRLKKKLGIQQIKAIPINESKEFGTIPAYRFPEYHVCPRCRKIGKYSGREFVEEDGVLYCKNPDIEGEPCNKIKTHPVRFIVTCKKGHINDFPWGMYVHKKGKYDPKSCKLYLRDEGETGSLKDLVVYCKTCKQERSVSEAFTNNKILGKCSGRRPWLRDFENDCENDKELLLRGASNIYFSSIESSIVIPKALQQEGIEEFIKENINLSDDELLDNRPMFDFMMKRNPDINRLGLDKVWNIVQKLRNGTDSSDDVDLRTPEYHALLTEHHNYEEIDFETEPEVVPERFKDYISDLVRIKRLKEVMVLKGFTRIHPLPDLTARLSGETDNSSDDNQSANDQVELAPLSATPQPFLPGVETYGEGIFLTINQEKLQAWENDHLDYGAGMAAAHTAMYRERKVPVNEIPPFPGLRYVLLHTLSHALIRELTMHSGYSSSALKERIYSDPEKEMAGILIYTATVDSEGSLGGLVELGTKDKFESILARTLSAACYCSGDPQCAEKDVDKLQDVNGAACHSCLLSAETSCEKSNRYLDRSLLVKTVANQQREFFNIE